MKDAADAARKKYKKDLDQLKPDLAAYTRQKEAALGLVPGSLSITGAGPSSSSTALALAGPSTVSAAQLLAAEDLYRDGNSLAYGDSKPTDDAIDRVVSKLNDECVAFSITYSLMTPLLTLTPGRSVLTSGASSHARDLTKRKVILHTSMSIIRCSIRRSVFFHCWLHGLTVS